MKQTQFSNALLWACTAFICILAGCGGGSSGTSSTTTPTPTPTPTPLTSATAVTDKGTVNGSDENTMYEFLGIPYAAPPVGDLRWKPPQPAVAWSSPRAATSFSSPCAQMAGGGTPSTSEDCLYLNVYVPKSGGPFPVMVWIHGGGLDTGAGSNFDPTALVNSGVIMVTLNYRLGALGFLAHQALTAESGSSGNFGLLDQLAALRWVRTNIAAFGGISTNVTLFGQSAGGLSTLALLTSPDASGLFQKAIVESGVYGIYLPPLSLTEASGQNFATAAGCASQTLDCLRSLPVSTLLANESSMFTWWGEILPSIDGALLPMSIDRALGTGNFNKVPILIGTTQHESSFMSSISTDIQLGHEASASDYPNLISAIFGSSASDVENAYPLTSAHTPAWTYDDVMTDLVWACRGRAVIQWAAAANGVPVYAYEFADANAPVVFNLPARTEGYGAYHASELQYVFPSAGYTIYYGTPFTQAQAALSAKMVGFWSQFAKASNPNAPGSAVWPAYTAANDTYLTLAPDAVAPTTTFSAEHMCSFWNYP